MGAMTLVSPVHATTAESSVASATTRINHKDSLRDVRGASVESSDSLKRVRTNKTADITKLTATYGRKLVITSTTRRTMPKDQMGVVARLATSGSDYDYQVDYVRGFIGQGNVLQLSTNEYEPVTCAGLKVKRANAKHRVKIIVPARCIGEPTRVRVGAVTLVQKGDRLFIDDAFDNTSDGYTIALSRWLKRR